MFTQSSVSSNSKSSTDGESKECARTVIPSQSRKLQKVTETDSTGSTEVQDHSQDSE